MEKGRKEKLVIWAICCFLIGSSMYSLVSTSDSLSSAPILLALLAIGYKVLKIVTGVTLYFKKAFTPYLALAIFVWTLIATIYGAYSYPEASLNWYSLVYITISLAIPVAFVVYCFRLKKRGYYVENIRA
jgi:hypothetical protein